MKSLLVPLVAFLLPSIAYSQCSNGRCGVPNTVTVEVAPLPDSFQKKVYKNSSVSHWVESDVGEKALYHNGVQIGSINDKGRFRFYDAKSDRWSEPIQLFEVKNCDQPPVVQKEKSKDCICKPECKCTDCLCASPKVEQPIGQNVTNFGMDWNHNAKDKEKYSFSGQEITRSKAFQELIGENLEDDSGKLDLTIISSNKALRQQVLNDLKTNPKLVEQLSQYKVSDYDPSHFHVSGMGYKSDGSPTIYIQKGNGEVLHRQDDYSGGPERLASALRRARPDYDPAKDPDLTKPKLPEPKPEPKPSPTPQPVPINSSVVIMALGAFFIWFLRR